MLKLADRCLVKILAVEGTHKLADKWEHEPYVVLRQPNPTIPVYKVRREDGQGKIKTMHRNLLLPLGYIVDQPVCIPKKTIRRQQLAIPCQVLHNKTNEMELSMSSSSDNSEAEVLVVHQKEKVNNTPF